MTRLIGRALRAAGWALAALTGALALAFGASIAADYRWRIRPGREANQPGPAPPPAMDEPAPPAPPRRSVVRAPARGLALFAGWTAAALTLALLLGLGGSSLAGYRSMTVMSGSMEPAIATGDVVVNRPIAPLDARVGDVVTFRDPGDASRFITHRVRHIRARDGRVAFVTKGDANNSTERWAVPVDGEIGRVDYRVPRLGYALFWTRGRYAKLGLITIPALLLGAMTLGRIWGLRRRDVSRGLTA